ncbi:uncharacterized protein LOC132068604 [Lycium ferocissimum]|uniref:uncharacterized protein LOC132068604 n=1 Tax=Lycium ferocissimum TaxID=112874 RepID=UPI002814B069|nr:uncharacterized protein LOC132068604 [Lycium ferocissimum]
MEQIPEPKRRKIRQVVLDILKTADLETATEFSVRTNAANLLGIQIFDLQEKQFIRRVLESFLLLDNNSKSNGEAVKRGEKQLTANLTQQEANVSLPSERFVESYRFICKLSDKTRVGILDIQGKPFVSIRDFYEKDEKLVPSVRGINLSARQWSSFKSSFPAIMEAIETMESKLRSKTGGNQAVLEAATQASEQSQTNIPPSVDQREGQNRKENGDDICNSVTATNSLVQMPIERRQETGSGISNLSPCFAPQRQIRQNSLTTFPAQSLLPIKTTRLDGKNYYCWKHQMEFSLKQLNIAYVLTEPCPYILENLVLGTDEFVQAKRAAQKWIDDDYLCCHNILSSLSDKLFEEYSKKNYSAKELWQELRATYDEDFGTKSSEVNKYLQFQMIDGISILEQVQELHKIADSLMASGIWIDENFHVNAIISKLPPSWKDCRARLMHEEVMSLNMLMHRIREEEDSHNRYRNEKRSNKVGARKRDHTNKQCYICGKEGHIAKNCRERNYQVSDKSNVKESETFPVVTDVKINGKAEELVAMVTGVKSNGKSDKISPLVSNTGMARGP